MSDILLIQPIVGLLDSVKDKPAIPLSLVTSATNLVQNYSVKIIDQRVDKNWRQTLTQELRGKPICVGTTAMLGPQIKYALEALKLTKEISPDTPTVWGGPQGGIMPELTVKHPAIDYVIQGDGEISLPLLIEYLIGKFNPLVARIIPGLHSKNHTGSAPWELIDINEQPDPPYFLAEPVSQYLPVRFGKPTIDVETSRGCSFNCAFCYNPYLHKRRWRALTAERTIQRIQKLHKVYGVESFWFIDDEFFIDLNRAKTIIQFMKNQNFTWTVQGTTIRNCLRMGNEFLELLSTSGCRQLNIGVESGSPKVLEEIGKKVKIEEVLEVNQKLKEHGIVPWFYFVVGFPTETPEDFKMTLKLITLLLRKNPEAKISGIGCYTPYPSTELYYTSLSYGYHPPENLEDYETYGVDDINIPWVLNDPEALTRVRGVQMTSFFIDNKMGDLGIPSYIKIPSRFYKPIARYRFSHQFFSIPLDINLGNFIKRRLNH